MFQEIFCKLYSKEGVSVRLKNYGISVNTAYGKEFETPLPMFSYTISR